MASIHYSLTGREIQMAVCPSDLPIRKHTQFTLWQLRALLERLENMGCLTGTQHAEVMSVMGMLQENADVAQCLVEGEGK